MATPNVSHYEASGLERLAADNGSPLQGDARAELERRRREYEDDREESRRAFETDRDRIRMEHENKLVEVRARLAGVQQEFDERLHREQLAHQDTLAARQETTTRKVSSATRAAALAAGLSAIGALIGGAAAIVSLLRQH